MALDPVGIQFLEFVQKACRILPHSRLLVYPDSRDINATDGRIGCQRAVNNDACLGIVVLDRLRVSSPDGNDVRFGAATNTLWRRT